MALADQTFGFIIPTVSLMGIGCAKDTGAQAKALGAKHLLIVTDAGLNKLGVADQIKDFLVAAGLQATIFAGAEPNPTDKNVADGLNAYNENNCDGIVTLGGGSSHDCGKGIGLVASNGGNIRDFEGVNKSTKPMPPFLAINTTAGTASEMTRFCIITNTDTHVKMAIVDWRVTPNIAINDPPLMVGMPASLTAATGMDALTHAVEAYVSTIATPITDACALQAIRLVANYLRPAVANGTNLEARDKMAYAEYLAGMALIMRASDMSTPWRISWVASTTSRTACVMQFFCPKCASSTRSLARSAMLISLSRSAKASTAFLPSTLPT